MKNRFRDQPIIEDFKRRIEKRFPGELIRLIVFGSQARGDATAESDIDVLAIVHSEDGPPEPRDRPAVRRQTTPGSTRGSTFPGKGTGGGSNAAHGCAGAARPREKGPGVGAEIFRDVTQAPISITK